MKYMVRKSLIQVMGTIWMPPGATAGLPIELSDHDVASIREHGHGVIDRWSVSLWLTSHAGDFASVDDFSASIESGDEIVDIPWSDESSEVVYNECVHGEDD